ncbi:hypothetical protein BN1221_02408 [Brenneria goodwinii]|uniref:Uncharacterized protein n=1 Tax=Brenneria goodwinii TaxID=1109412 RepID=A0A0G4JW74_9GAMM|nr:hypothetical protein BN1221_02408 [Brenneria goodwinii]
MVSVCDIKNNHLMRIYCYIFMQSYFLSEFSSNFHDVNLY